jgi:hypothetical protein
MEGVYNAKTVGRRLQRTAAKACRSVALTINDM